MAVFWRIVSWILWPLRLFGLGSDAYTLWSYREQIVTAASALSGSVVAIAFAIAQRYPPWVPPLFALVAFAVVLALAGWGVKLNHYLASRHVAPEPPTSQTDAPPSVTTNIDTIYIENVNTGAQRLEDSELVAQERERQEAALDRYLEQMSPFMKGGGESLLADSPSLVARWHTMNVLDRVDPKQKGELFNCCLTAG